MGVANIRVCFMNGSIVEHDALGITYFSVDILKDMVACWYAWVLMFSCQNIDYCFESFKSKCPCSRSYIAWKLKKFENTKVWNNCLACHRGCAWWEHFCVTKMKHDQTIWFCRDELSFTMLFWEDIIAWLVC